MISAMSLLKYLESDKRGGINATTCQVDLGWNLYSS